MYTTACHLRKTGTGCMFLPKASPKLFHPLRLERFMAKLPRIEWISLLYLVLFVLAVMSPSLVHAPIFGVSEVHAEEVLIFLFGIVGLGTFSLYERIMEGRETERAEAVRERDQTRRELVSSYEYIGAVNRQIDALKKISNETAASLTENGAHKQLFQSLALSAASHVHSQQATIRIVAIDQMRTLREYHADPQMQVPVPNKDLKQAFDEDRSHTFVHGQDGREILVIPSDAKTPESKVFILIPTSSGQTLEVDPGLLKVYANQAEVLYRLLAV
jgi:hypothetical protein